MKFQCDRCKTRYSIADEKVRGKILKIRCKACEAIIQVRDGGPAKLQAGLTAGAGVPRAATHTIEIGRQSGSVPSIAPDPAGTNPAAKLPDAEGAPEEWYLSVGGRQEGPLSPDQAQKRVAASEPGIEMHAWRDDFAEWLPVADVPVLAVHLPRAKPRTTAPVPLPVAAGGSKPEPLAPPPVRPAVAPVPPPPPPDLFGPPTPTGEHTEISEDPFGAMRPDIPAAGTPPPAASSSGDGLDFEIGEASRLVKLPLGPPPPTSSPGRRLSDLGLPGLAGRADDSLKLNIGSAGETGPRPLSASSSVTVPRRRLLVPILGAGLVVGILLAVVALFALRGGEPGEEERAAAGEQPALVKDFYNKENPIVPRPAPVAAPAPPPAPAPVPPPEVEKPRVPTSGTSTRPRPPVVPPVVAYDPSATPPRKTPKGGKVDTFDGDNAVDGESLTPDDVRSMYGANEVGLKRCYERSLKTDPAATVSKMVVKITITPDGRVTDIRVPEAGTLAECVAGNIRAWRFRKTASEFTTEFTVYFARRG